MKKIAHAIVVTTLAEYQTRFWLMVAAAMHARGNSVRFISFDDRSTEMIRAAGYSVHSATEQVAPTDTGALFKSVGLSRLTTWTAHERFAFGRNDDAAMIDKLARSIIATQAALAGIPVGVIPVMVQEVGGFLSVVGSYFAARAAKVSNWFIEPSFFRGRILLTLDTFAAPRFAAYAVGKGGPLFDSYIEATLSSGAIVIPLKDRHQYSSARRKVFSLRNALRLAEKLVDKYVLGKHQEFGFIGSHVGTHLRMLTNSHRLRGRYTSLEALDRFVYYPLHVPGDMALTVRSPEYLDQLALIDYLCRTLPDGCNLALKEHPAMIGMVDARRMIALLKRYPNLALIDPATSNYAVMRDAAAIVTVNSKSGAEAGLLGRPVIVLGDAFYRDAMFATPVDRLTTVPRALDAVLANEAPTADPAKVRAWFAAVWEASLPGELYAEDEDGARMFAASLCTALSLPNQ